MQRQRPFGSPRQPHGQEFGGDQLAGCGEIGLQRCPRDGDASGFERFAQGLQYVTIELRYFVEKQHAEMRQRDLARLRRIAPAHQRRCARRMMGRAERSLPPLHR